MSYIINFVGIIFWCWLSFASTFAFILTQATWLAVVGVVSTVITLVLVYNHTRL